MIKHFVGAWDSNKDILKDYLKTHKQEEYNNNYENLFKTLLKVCLNGFNGVELNYDDIKVIDYGHYQGSLILVFSYKTYQPSVRETFYTSVDYGSCGGCDALQSILDIGNYTGIATEEQISEYMTLCLHLVQNINCFKEE